MDINIVGLGLGITDRFREYANEKSEKISHLAEQALSLEIKVSRHHDAHGRKGEDRVELTLVGPGPLVRAESTGSDKYVAFDLALARLLERLRRSKDRKKVHRGKQRTSLHAATTDGFTNVGIVAADPELIEQVSTGSVATITDEHEEDAAYTPVVIRTKEFPAEWLSVEDAVDRMELVGHDFFLFIDSGSERASVVYRRKGWDYGVISLDDEQVVGS
ncbi:ribosome hibernation-promoting factor, HPF/YfiA family [Plantibacter sp. YIM 135249]|uniref:ribosome hibernation-promoting factor, HPF/YfiA family n=1 Tax=Plantibacter sp. YIM 135249 TaxID=3423918 RepID=UPI003D33269F